MIAVIFGNMVGDAFLSAAVVTREFGFNRGIIPHGFPQCNLLMKCLWKRQIIAVKLVKVVCNDNF